MFLFNRRVFSGRYGKRNVFFALLVFATIYVLLFTNFVNHRSLSFLRKIKYMLVEDKPAMQYSGGSDFMIDGKPTQILSGAIHYFRVPPEYWQDRLRKLASCGLNTVETYVPWNLHEETPGKFNFSAHLDVVKFIKLAQDEGLMVIFRPGPYICSEWDLGGLPSWLLRDPNMKVRTNYPGYQTAVKNWFEYLLPLILPLQRSQGGPIIMIQIENEYGSYRQDDKHLVWLQSLLISIGVKEKLFTSDGWRDGKFEAGSIEGVLAVVNDKDTVEEALDYYAKRRPNDPLMLGEFWTGWFDHWTEQHHTVDEDQYTQLLHTILARGASVNLYMFHGGTNFGFLNGANRKNGKYLADVTSYDYDAPLSENGDFTPKAFATAKLIGKMGKRPGFVFAPEEMEVVRSSGPSAKDYGSFAVTQQLLLTDALTTVHPWSVTDLTPMERICDVLAHKSATECVAQNFGFIAYRTQVPSSAKTVKLDIVLRDRGLIIVNGKTVKTIESFDKDSRTTLDLNFSDDRPSDLIILVENMGRVNYALYPERLDDQLKGIVSGKMLIDGSPVKLWQVYPLEMKREFIDNLSELHQWRNVEPAAPVSQPAFYRIPLDKMDLKSDLWNQLPSDTFLRTEGWTKGAAFINGFNLGRYWNKGPQKTLFVPGPRLTTSQEGAAIKYSPLLILFELHKAGTAVEFLHEPQL